MPHRLRLTAVAVLIVPLLSISRTLAADETGPPSLIPEPVQLVRGDGQFRLSVDTPIICATRDRACDRIADYLFDLIERTTVSYRAHRNRSVPGIGAVLFERTAASQNREAYRLVTSPSGVKISAGTDAGLFYGAVSLWQLASQKEGASGPVDVPTVEITDAPRFGWRGLLLDSARHYQSPVFIKSFIDAMALHKLNVLQWHLTDDQGWRLQIKRYPRLTSVGAWRRGADGKRYGGYYTQAQVRDIVGYARRHNVTIVPEIEMPGHALAAIVAYPQLGSVSNPPREVSGDWGVFPDIYNVDDRTLAFLKNVLTEVMALFPSRYIHVGGDEAVKDQWNASPQIMNRMRRLQVKDADALQAWLIARIARFLEAHHRRMIGWDEILTSELPPDAAVTSWRTIDSAAQAAQQGHDVVLAPSPTLYFDNCQVRAPTHPCRGNLVTLKDVYEFDPIPPSLSAPKQAHILGVQANLWTEYMDRDDRVARAAFPRAAALAEVAWSPAGLRDWPDFVSRLHIQLGRYSRLGIPVSNNAFATELTAVPTATGARVSLANQVGMGDIHYILDHTVSADTPITPDRFHPEKIDDSPLYSGPFETTLPAMIEFGARLNGRPMASISELQLLTARSIIERRSFDLDQCTNDLPLALASGDSVVMVNVMNPCWVYKGLDLTGISAFDFDIVRFRFSFQIGKDIAKIPLYPDAAPEGQLEIRLDTCKGERLAVQVLPGNSGTTLHVKVPPRPGVHDLCFLFARRGVDPVWAIDRVRPVKE